MLTLNIRILQGNKIPSPGLFALLRGNQCSQLNSFPQHSAEMCTLLVALPTNFLLQVKSLEDYKHAGLQPLPGRA